MSNTGFFSEGARHRFDDSGDWPLVPFACFFGWIDVLKVLRIFSMPKDINAKHYDRWNRDGKNPLMLACANGHQEVVRFLVSSYEIDFNVTTDTIHWTPLHYASGNPEMVQLFLDTSKERNLSIDINAKNMNGDTPLHWVCLDSFNCNFRALEILIANGANILERNNQGKYAFTQYWRQSNERFLEILNMTEDLTTLEKLKLFTENLDILSDAIPKHRKFEVPYTIPRDEYYERERCNGQRIVLLFLKTFRDQNIDLQTVEDQFENAENA